MGPEDHTLKHFFERFFEGFANAEGKAFLSLRLLVTRPGRLTADCLRGKRKPYIPPFQLFLIANLIFFLLHPLVGSDTLTTDLHTQLRYTWHSAIVRDWVTPRLLSRGMTTDAYAATFDPAAVKLARSLVILVVPIFSLAVMALYFPHRRRYAAHLVFSLHFCAFWLLMICAVLALTNLSARLLRYAHVFPSDLAVNRSIIAASLAIMTFYLFCAVREVFAREAAWVTAAKAIALGVAFDLSLQAYRFVLFFLTYWWT
jgi:Protein of unknown function (DUF3667)